MSGRAKSSLHYSQDALRDLDDIWDYILLEFSNPEAAAKTVDDIMNAIDKLMDFPRMGAKLSSIVDVECDYRFLVTGNYMTFSRLEEEDVYIDHILYGKRDYLRVLFGDERRTK